MPEKRPLNSQLRRYVVNSGIDINSSDDVPIEKVMELLHYVEMGYAGKRKEISILENALDISSREIQTYLSDLKSKSILLTNNAKMSALGEMAGGVAHEINNPLAIISGIAKRITRKLKNNNADPKMIEEGLVAITETTGRIVEIVNGLRLISRNADNDVQESVSVQKIIQDSLVLCTEKFKHNGITLRKEYDPDLNLFVKGRATQYSQVLLNLLNNSFDSVCALDDKWISINVSTNQDTAIIRVTDSGEKISDDIIDNIMQPFFTTKEVGEGTGLGLSISLRIIEDQHGKLYYDRESPNASFVIEVPLATPPTESTL